VRGERRSVVVDVDVWIRGGDSGSVGEGAGEGRRGAGMSDDGEVDLAAGGGAGEQEGDVRSKLSMSAGCVFRWRGDVRRGSAMTRVLRAGWAVQSELGAGAGDRRQELDFEVGGDWDALEDMD
jgi:hypothetical protein